MNKMQNPQSFTIQGKLVFQSEDHFEGKIENGINYGVVIHRAVQQNDGSFWSYCFYKGQSVGTPCRGKARQKQILEFVEKVKEELK